MSVVTPALLITISADTSTAYSAKNRFRAHVYKVKKQKTIINLISVVALVPTTLLADC